jgi:hypothetical protein
VPAPGLVPRFRDGRRLRPWWGQRCDKSRLYEREYESGNANHSRFHGYDGHTRYGPGEPHVLDRQKWLQLNDVDTHGSGLQLVHGLRGVHEQPSGLLLHRDLESHDHHNGCSRRLGVLRHLQVAHGITEPVCPLSDESVASPLSKLSCATRPSVNSACSVEPISSVLKELSQRVSASETSATEPETRGQRNLLRLRRPGNASVPRNRRWRNDNLVRGDRFNSRFGNPTRWYHCLFRQWRSIAGRALSGPLISTVA